MKVPQECEELKDQSAVQNFFLSKSVKICNVLGILISTLKKQFGQTGIDKQFMCHLEFDKCSKSNNTFAKMQKELFYAGLLAPFKDFSFIKGQGNKKKREVTAIEHILMDSLKQSNELCKAVLHYVNSL